MTEDTRPICEFCGAEVGLEPYSLLGEMVLACMDVIACIKRASDRTPYQADLMPEDHRYSEEQNG